jgi:hypothetical protein
MAGFFLECVQARTDLCRAELARLIVSGASTRTAAEQAPLYLVDIGPTDIALFVEPSLLGCSSVCVGDV